MPDASQQTPCPLASELPHIAAPLAPFLALCPAQTPSPSISAPPLPHQDAAPPTQRETDTTRGLVTQEVQLDADAAAALALPPVLPPGHRTYQLSEKGILEMTGVSLIGMLTQLNLHGSALKKIEASGRSTTQNSQRRHNAMSYIRPKLDTNNHCTMPHSSLKVEF